MNLETALDFDSFVSTDGRTFRGTLFIVGEITESESTSDFGDSSVTDSWNEAEVSDESTVEGLFECFEDGSEIAITEDTDAVRRLHREILDAFNEDMGERLLEEFA